ncbi:MAG: cobalamin-dependent protein [Myxococcales bacterium]|nr:MAG: cobalamin-dependent protein [Myxococcales bacterium]
MKIKFIYAGFQRHAEAHPELLDYVPCDEYFGPPSLGIAYLAAVTPKTWEIDFRDDRLEDIGLDDDVDLVAISCFTPSAVRAMEIADAFRARGKRVVFGGIFPSMMPEIVKEHADAVVIGEGDGIWPQLLDDAQNNQLKPIYQAAEPTNLETLPLPRVDLYMEKEGRNFCPDDYPVQLHRGCPLSCVACVLPKSMGRRSRNLPVQHALDQIEMLGKRGKLASLTEDTSFFPNARRHFGELLDVLAERGQAAISYVGISMPVVLATREQLFQRMRAAGIKMFYLVGGFDPITKGAFTGKDPKAYQQALETIKKCHDNDIEPYTSFLVGNDDDDAGCFDRILDFADHAKVRKAEFAILTPYPGTPIWQSMTEQDRLLHRDWSKYNDANVVFKPKQMSPEQLQEGYLHLWKEFYRSRQSISKLDTHRERTIQF